MSSNKLTIEDRDDMVRVDDSRNRTPHSGRHFKTYFLILLVVIFSPLGNVLLSTGMKEVGPMTFRSTSEFLDVFVRVFTSGAIWLGIASLFAYFISYMLVLSWADYSYVQPATAMGYVIVALLGHFVLHETVSPLRWIGISLIFLGVLIVGHTPPRTTEHRQC
jgi:drug/metabolite transporter (DMT)-like permease